MSLGSSELNASRRRSCALGIRTDPGSPARSAAGSSSSAAVWGGSSPSTSVLRNRAASGPSRMLARLLGGAIEDLLGEIAVGLGGAPARGVAKHRHPLDGSLVA